MLWIVPTPPSQDSASNSLFLSKAATTPSPKTLLPKTTPTPPFMPPQSALPLSKLPLAGLEAQSTFLNLTEQDSLHLPLVLTYSGLCAYYKEKRRDQLKVYEDINAIFEIMQDYARRELLTQEKAIVALIQMERRVMRRVLNRHYKVEEALENHLCLLRDIIQHMKD